MTTSKKTSKKPGKKRSPPTKTPAKTPAPAEPEVRRVPTQDRSRARVARILEAATEVFADQGFDAATTELIAERAGTSIGSLYQFFPNKRSLLEAIGRQYFDDVRALFDRLLIEASARVDGDWLSFVDDAIEAFWTLDQSSKAFRAVWLNVHRSGEFLSEGDALNRSMAERLAPLLGVAAPRLAPARRILVATIVVETLSALLFLALRRDPRAARKVIDEAKVLVRGYLAPFAQ